ncbi:MAG: endosialidase [Lachnospiraceae bacterium]|nr:endosialidase [Lachnospiraceae bacterium]
MAVINELIRLEADGSISFGDYSLGQKTKKDNVEFNGSIYKVKTFNEITKLERDGMFVYESVPGTTVNNLKSSGEGVEFVVEGNEDAQITLELEPDTLYNISVGGKDAGGMKTNLGGKLSLSVELDPEAQVSVSVSKQ